MGVVIYGRRAYGRVHQHEGEYADTQFAHIDFIPLFPIGSFWVTQDLGNGQRMGFPIKLNGLSVVATYLRIWAPLVAIALATVHSLASVVAGLVIAALSVWSWTWRSRHGELAQRRSDFDQVALGSRCDPAWMSDEMRDGLAERLHLKRSARLDARPADEVARFGARDVDEAILAYGALRLESVHHPEAGKAADRLLASAFEKLPQHGGPYRETPARPQVQLGPAILAAAPPPPPPARKRWFHNPWLQLVGLVLLTFNVAKGTSDWLRPTASIDADVLSGADLPIGHSVRVQCDRIENDDWRLVLGGKVEQRITFCWLGERVLPIVTRDGSELAKQTVEGELHEIGDVAHEDRAWVTELRDDADLQPAAYSVYVLRDKHERLEVIFSIALVLATLAAWAAWLRQRVKQA